MNDRIASGIQTVTQSRRKSDVGFPYFSVVVVDQDIEAETFRRLRVQADCLAGDLHFVNGLFLFFIPGALQANFRCRIFGIESIGRRPDEHR